MIILWKLENPSLNLVWHQTIWSSLGLNWSCHFTGRRDTVHATLMCLNLSSLQFLKLVQRRRSWSFSSSCSPVSTWTNIPGLFFHQPWCKWLCHKNSVPVAVQRKTGVCYWSEQKLSSKCVDQFCPWINNCSSWIFKKTLCHCFPVAGQKWKTNQWDKMQHTLPVFRINILRDIDSEKQNMKHTEYFTAVRSCYAALNSIDICKD